MGGFLLVSMEDDGLRLPGERENHVQPNAFKIRPIGQSIHDDSLPLAGINGRRIATDSDHDKERIEVIQRNNSRRIGIAYTYSFPNAIFERFRKQGPFCDMLNPSLNSED
jgi:hypothetical protein